jgi:hypothetical protein
MRCRRWVLPSLALVLAVACTGDTPTSETTSTASPIPASGSVDPLVPYSPSPTPFTERTSGFIPDTLTLPTADGSTLTLTPVTTTMTLGFVDGARAFVVYLDVHDRSDTPWKGAVGAQAQVIDVNGGVFPAEPPAPGDLHPDPGRYGGSNRNLLREISVPARGSVSGALVFHVTGGNRPITLRVSLDGGQTWGEWATNLGTF